MLAGKKAKEACCQHRIYFVRFCTGIDEDTCVSNFIQHPAAYALKNKKMIEKEWIKKEKLHAVTTLKSK